MNKELVKRKIRDSVLKLEADAQVILFGSRARNTEHEFSDWDILVLLNQPSLTFKDEQRFRHELFDIALEIEEPISTFVYTVSDWNNKMNVTPLFQNVKRDGIVL